MSGLLGNISLGLGTTTKGMGKGIADARKEIGTLDAQFAKVTSGIKGFVATVGTLAALGGLTKFAISGVKSLNQLAIVAESTGTSIDALKGLQYAASVTGSDVDALTSVFLGLNKTLAEAATSDDEVSFALRSIGLSARDLLSLSPEDALGSIADALGKIANPGERAAKATQILGGESTKFLRVLDGGRAGIKSYIAERNKLGGSFGNLDTKQVAVAQKSFAQLSEVVVGIKDRILIGLAPVVSALSQSLASTAVSGTTAFTAIGSAAELTSFGVAKIEDVLGTVSLGFSLFSAKITGMLGNIVHYTSIVFDAIGAGIDALPGKLDRLKGYLGKGLADTLTAGFGDNLVSRDLVAKTKPTPDRGQQKPKAPGFLGAYEDELKKLEKEQRRVFEAKLIAPTASEKLTKFYDDLRSKVKATGDEIARAAKEQGNFGQGLATGEVLQKVQEFTAKLQIEQSTIGRSDGFKQLSELQRHGAEPKHLQRASDLLLQNQAKETVTSQNRATLDAAPQSRFGQLQKILDDFARAQVLFAKGIISQDQLQVADLTKRQQMFEFQQPLLEQQAQPTRFASAAELGSQEAHSAAIQAISGGAPDQARAAIEIAKQQLDALRRIAGMQDKLINVRPPAQVINVI